MKHEKEQPKMTDEEIIQYLAEQGDDPVITPEVLDWIRRQPRL